MYAYDTSIRVGDIVTSYSKGYFRVVGIERRFYTKEDEKHFDHLERESGRRPKVGDEYNPRFHLRKLLDSNLKKRSGGESCDACFCSRPDPAILTRIEELITSDPSIESDSKRKYARSRAETARPIQLSDEEVEAARRLLAACVPGQPVEEVLNTICPRLFSGVELANGFVNSAKQFAVRLNDGFRLDVIYNEKENKVTEYVRGDIIQDT